MLGLMQPSPDLSLNMVHASVLVCVPWFLMQRYVGSSKKNMSLGLIAGIFSCQNIQS